MGELGISATELSERSGVSAASISRYLNGIRQPTIDSLVSIADALDKSSDYLLGRSGEPDGKKLVDTYSVASSDDKRVIWTLLERYGGGK